MELRKGRSSAGKWFACLFVFLFSGILHAGKVTYVYTDPQGTPLAEADANGTIIATYDYAPYGQPVASMSGSPNGPGYTGHVNDPETGLVYMRARYYDPGTGRFLSVDPVAPEPGNFSNFGRYHYASNNPVINIDPDGMKDIYIGGAWDKGKTRIVQDFAQRQQQLHPDRDIQYFSYKEGKEIASELAKPLQENEPLNVIGHSFGAREAVSQAISTSSNITNLITIDPVGSAGNGAKPSNVSTWSNVTASPSDRNSSDTIASIGRKLFGTTDTTGANPSQSSTSSHGDFPQMMSQIDALQKIESSYKEKPQE